MIDMPDLLYLLVNNPMLIAVPIVIFAGLAVWSQSATAWAATAAWNLYLIYELGMKAEELCSGTDCMKRTPLYVVYPLLAILSLVALVQVYVHIRDKREHELRLKRGTPSSMADLPFENDPRSGI